MEEFHLFQANDLREFASSYLVALGITPSKACIVAEHLVNANLMGHDSHGVLLLAYYADLIGQGQIDGKAEAEILTETSTLAKLDGHWGIGQVIGKEAMELAIQKAIDSGIACVTVSRSNHIGRLGEYTQMAACAGMIGVAMVNNHGGGQTVAPWGGIARRLSTNPLSVCVPTGGRYPVLLDMSTSVVAEGKIWVALSRKAKIPYGWIIDSQGNPTDDPAKLYEEPPGSILPFGGIAGYKGFGLNFMVDILAGALSGAGCSREGCPYETAGNGVFMIALNIAPLRSLADFQKEVDRFIAYIKSCPRASGVDEILVPGEAEFRCRERRLREGVPIEIETIDKLRELAGKLGIPFCTGDAGDS